MKSQLMFEVNISSKWACGKCCTRVGWSPNSCSKWTSARSELAASAAPKLDEVPTHVRSERSLKWACSPLHNKLDEVPTLFEVNTQVTDLQSAWTSELKWAAQQVLLLGKCPWETRVSPSVICFPRSERITDKSLRSKFQKLLEWPEPLALLSMLTC